jgi:hypothetical protein
MAKKSKKTSGARKRTHKEWQITLGVNFALRNADFSERCYPNGEPDWYDDNVRKETANHVLSFGIFSENDDHVVAAVHSPGEVALIRAFQTLHLNPMNPYHWRFLLGVLACAQFGEVPKGKPAGATPRWNDAAKLRMAIQIGKVCLGAGKKLNAKAVAKLLKREFPEEYKSVTVDHVYNRVRELKNVRVIKKGSTV